MTLEPAVRSAPLAERRAPAGAEDELTELLAELLERAWRRRHPQVSPPTTQALENTVARQDEVAR